MKKIIFDCDDVLANLREDLQHIIAEEHGGDVNWRDWKDFHGLDDQYNIDFDNVLEKMVDRSLLESLMPERFAVETVNHFKDQDYHIYVLTARAFHPEGERITEKWVEHYGMPVDEVIAVDANHCKTDVIKTLGEIEIFIDDHPGHILNASALNNTNHVYLRNRPWNKHIDYDHRIDCLSELMDKHDE